MQNQFPVLELIVRNHPGVMSHVCGLFARRAFNVEGIVCLPISGSEQSRIWLQVQAGDQLEQMIRQLEKLEDVISVLKPDLDSDTFDRLPAMFKHQTRTVAPGSTSVV